MIEFGKTLREAREAKGYTVSQIAEMTHLKPTIVEQLEHEDFSSIAAPIYGRGFIKLYSEAVGLDPKPLVEEFMAIINGEHEISIRERPIAGSQASQTETEVPPPAPPPPPPPPSAPAPQPDLFSQNEPVATAAAVPPPPPPPRTPAEMLSKPLQAPALSRYAAPVGENPPTYGTTPSFNLRIAVLATLAIALLAALILGLRSLYHATSPDTAEPTPTANAAEAPAEAPTEARPAKSAPEKPAPAKAVSTAKPATRTELQKIPSLYID